MIRWSTERGAWEAVPRSRPERLPGIPGYAAGDERLGEAVARLAAGVERLSEALAALAECAGDVLLAAAVLADAAEKDED